MTVVDFDAGNEALDGYDPAALYDEYRELHPDWAKRKGGGKTRRTGTVHTKSGVTFRDSQGLTDYVGGAASPQDFAKRCEVALEAGKKLAPAGSKEAEALELAIADGFNKWG